MQKLSDCENLFRVLHTTAGRRVICFTRVYDADTLGVCVSDGLTLWKTNVENFSQFVFEHLPNDASAVVKTGGANDSALTRFRTTFHTGKITVSESGDQVGLSISGQELSTLDLELPEAKASDKNTELKSILFHLADKVTEADKNLKAAEKKIEVLEQKAATVNTGKNVFDMTADVKRKKMQAKVLPKAPGMSAINPGSKKRAAPKGVQFD